MTHSKAKRLGRPLHPIETRWVVCREFRKRFVGLHNQAANELTLYTMEKIRVMMG